MYHIVHMMYNYCGNSRRQEWTLVKYFDSDVSTPIRVPSSGNGGKVMIQENE